MSGDRWARAGELRRRGLLGASAERVQRSDEAAAAWAERTERAGRRWLDGMRRVATLHDAARGNRLPHNLR